MRTYVLILVLLFTLSSCQENKQEVEDLDNAVEKKKTSNTASETSKSQKPEKILTEADFERFFPKKINTYNLLSFSESESQGIGTATYIKGKDYGNIMHYFVTDGLRKGSADIRNFDESYLSNIDWPKGTELISMERDGFKTVAFLRHDYNNYKISVVYNNRFVLTVEGHEKPDELWDYLKQADLKLLDEY